MKIEETITETKQKITSLKYWFVSMLDATIPSAGMAVIGTPALDMAGLAEMNLRLAFALFAINYAMSLFRFWIRNPLKDTLEDY